MPEATLDQVRADLRAARAQLVRLTRDLIRCHPVYGSAGQREALRLCARTLRAAGMRVSLPRVRQDVVRGSPHYVDVSAFGAGFGDYDRTERHYVQATMSFGSAGPHVLLNGHVDVEFVTDPERWGAPERWRSGTIRDGRIHGRGASDMLGGVACYLFVASHLRPYLGQAAGRLTVQLVLDEEVGGNGTLAALLQHPDQRPDVAIVAEPTDRTVCTTSRGFHQFAIRHTGAPVHMAFAGAHDNAVSALPALVAALEDVNTWIVRELEEPGSTRYVMYGTVHGGGDAAMPAEEVRLGVTFALPPRLSVARVLAELDSRLRSLCGTWPRRPELMPYGISFEGHTGAGAVDWAATMRSVARELGISLSMGAFPSACDARLLESFAIPTVVYGPGSLSRAHGSAEWVDVAELDEYCAVLAATLLRSWGVT